MVDCSFLRHFGDAHYRWMDGGKNPLSIHCMQTCLRAALVRGKAKNPNKAQGSSLGSNGQVASGSCRNWERGLTVCGVPGPLLASLRVAALAAAF